MPRWSALFPLMVLAACGAERSPEDWSDWYGPMGDVNEDVQEPVEFTDEAYSYPESGPGLAGIAHLFQDFNREYAPDDVPPNASCGNWGTTTDLPVEVWAMVTAHPRYYYKSEGCNSQQDQGDSEEKYYGSFWVEDNTGGLFVLGDSKVAHFDMGDRVKIRIRGVQRSFGLNMVVAHDIVEVDRGPYPIAFEAAPPISAVDTFDESLVGSVLRVEGTVTTEPDTFGQFSIVGDDGSPYDLALDTELNRRGVIYPIGSRIRATGPMQRSFGDKIILMRVGQVERLDVQ